MSEVLDLTSSEEGRLRPFCPACKKQLNGELVATKCGHVFHRECLTADTLRCPRCDRPGVRENTLDLYGVSFDEGQDPGSLALTSSAASSGADGSNTDVEATQRAIAEVCALKARLRERRKPVDQMSARAAEALKEATKQREKLKLSQKTVDRRVNERQQLLAEIEKFRQEHEALAERMDQIRQRDTVLEYAEMLRSKPEKEALGFLSKMVSVVPAPWKILVEVARLRNDYRARLDAWQKENAAAARKEREQRAQLLERSRKITELERGLQKLRGSREEKRRRLEL